VHFSVYWWRTLHPSGPTPANLASGSGLGGTELLAFFTALAAFTLLFSWLLALRVRVGELADRVEELELRRQFSPPAPAAGSAGPPLGHRVEGAAGSS
ncbi:MAG: hypothetical protein ACRDLB_15955, partial [Actinomycetota bacterium]